MISKEPYTTQILRVLGKKPKNKPHEAVSEASQEFDLLEHCNNHRKKAINEEALISDQETSKRNELRLQKSPQQN
jgi:hypothetical protein